MRPGYVFVDDELVGDGEERGIVVAPVSTSIGVPFIVVVEPCSPAGAPDSGIVVGDG
jgi:hypothetical protein